MKQRIILATIVWGSAVLAGGPPPAGEGEAAYIVVTTWNDDCDGNTLSTLDNMVDAWYDEIRSSAFWVGSSARVNGSIGNDDFADEELYDWGDDQQEGNLDGEDAIMIGLHGGEQEADGTNAWFGVVRVDSGGGDDEDCFAEQNTAPQAADNEILLDGDAEFVHLVSCHSMCDDNRADWRDSYDRVHLITGFHGTTWSSSSLVDDYEDFAADAFEMSIASAWLDQLYKEEIGCYCDTRVAGICVDYDYYENCPVAQAGGTSAANARDHRDEEEYDNVMTDPDVTDNWAWTWMGGCNPKNDPAQPD